jgi:hypothetical protein
LGKDRHDEFFFPNARTSRPCQIHCNLDTFRAMGVGSDAYGATKLPRYAPTPGYSSSVGFDRENLPHIPGRHYNLVVVSGRTQEEHSFGLRSLEGSTPVLLDKKISTILDRSPLPWPSHFGEGIQADGSKVDRVLKWRTPTSAKEVHQFLGLVRYISAFLPALAEHTALLTPLTKKECNARFPTWTTGHQKAFESIKKLVLGRDCLTTIEHKEPGENRIFVTCDASKRRTGAVLSFGKTWETARPVAFESRQLKGAELHYPVHEQEMLR